MRLTSPDPLGRALLGSVGAVALVAALVVPHVDGRSDRTKHHVAGAVRPAADGIVAPPRDEWLRLRASEGRGDGKPPRHVAAASTSQHDRVALPTTGAAVPTRALRAYVSAARATDRQLPSCRLKWNLLAGIGFIESGHAHSGGSDDPHWNGLARPPIYGPLLDGTGKWRAFADTDGGRLDGNRLWDRAVGPRQFMPSTWVLWGADGNDDGHADPQQIDDAALAAAHYLCAAGGDLSQVPNLHRAVHAYNHDSAYVRAVLSVAAYYAGVDPSVLGVRPVHKHHAKRHRHRRAAARASTSPSARTSQPAPGPSSSSPPSSASTPAPVTAPTPEPTQSTPDVSPIPTDTATTDPGGTPTPTDTPTDTPT